MEKELEKYVLDHISPEDDILSELSRETHLKIYHPRQLSGHLQGKVLEMISIMIKPDFILELGSYTGYSAICLAKGLSPDGKIYTIEINDELEDIFNKYVEKSGFQDKVIQIKGDAIDVIPTLEIEFDLVFIDANKRFYKDYYDAVFDKVKSGGYIIADNVLWDGKIVKEIKPNDHFTKGILEFNDYIKNDSRVEKVLLPLRDGMMIIRKI